MEKEIYRQNAEAEANKALRELVKHLREENGRLVRANTELKDETYFFKNATRTSTHYISQ